MITWIFIKNGVRWLEEADSLTISDYTDTVKLYQYTIENGCQISKLVKVIQGDQYTEIIRKEE